MEARGGGREEAAGAVVEAADDVGIQVAVSVAALERAAGKRTTTFR